LLNFRQGGGDSEPEGQKYASETYVVVKETSKKSYQDRLNLDSRSHSARAGDTMQLPKFHCSYWKLFVRCCCWQYCC